MTDRPDHFEAGRQLLELQLTMLKGAMTLMSDSAQRFVELSLGAAAPATRARAHDQEQAGPRAAPAAPPKTARRTAGGGDYTSRMQEDVDSILHAFAMVPDAADRLLRTSALLSDKPGRAARERKPAPARRDAAEHAR